jgi:hypothetical protein
MQRRQQKQTGTRTGTGWAEQNENIAGPVGSKFVLHFLDSGGSCSAAAVPEKVACLFALLVGRVLMRVARCCCCARERVYIYKFAGKK